MRYEVQGSELVIGVRDHDAFLRLQEAAEVPGHVELYFNPAVVQGERFNRRITWGIDTLRDGQLTAWLDLLYGFEIINMNERNRIIGTVHSYNSAQDNNPGVAAEPENAANRGFVFR